MKCGFVVLATITLLLQESLAFSEAMSDQYRLEWEYTESNIILKITAATRGYVGVGFSKTTTMKESDIIIAGVRDGIPYVWDCYSDGNGHLGIDTEQDVTITKGVENSTHTSVTVTRSLSANGSNDYNLNSSEVNVIWAFGQADKGLQRLHSDYHGLDKGLRRLKLIRDTSEGVETDRPPTAGTSAETPPTYNYSNISRFDDLSYEAFLDRNKQIHLRWDFDDETLVLQLTAPTLGWIGVGFSTKVSMAGADLIIMGMRNDEVYAINCHAEKDGPPIVDDIQDIKVLSGYENGSHTSVRILRKLKPCNKQDLNIYLERTLRILWAYGGDDITGNTPEDLNYHGPENRGGRSLILTNDQKFSTTEGIGKDLKYWDAAVENVSVPAKTTYYRCVLLKLPTNGTFYAKAYEPIIDTGNELNVHHILLYGCSSSMWWFEHGASGECYTEINPYEVGCGTLFAGWAVGSIGVALPEKIAFTLPSYMIVEIHYDNPSRREFVDNSGMRIHYTEERPEILMGTLQIEESISHIVVPPKSKNFLVAGYCQPECIAKGMASAGVSEVTVYSSFLHSHTAGRAIRVRHFRDDKELKPLSQDDNYDFDYQESRYLPPGTKIRTGDSFRIECVYDTTDRENVTTGGLPTSSEMCMAFLNYYPAIDVSACYSRPKLAEDFTVANQLASDLGLTIGLEEFQTLAKKAQNSLFTAEVLTQELNKVNWTDEKKQVLTTFMDNTPRYSLCLGERGLLMNYFNEFKTPKFEDFTPINDDKCVEMSKTDSTIDSKSLTALKAAAAAMIFLLVGVAWKIRS